MAEPRRRTRRVFRVLLLGVGALVVLAAAAAGLLYLLARPNFGGAVEGGTSRGASARRSGGTASSATCFRA